MSPNLVEDAPHAVQGSPAADLSPKVCERIVVLSAADQGLTSSVAGSPNIRWQRAVLEKLIQHERPMPIELLAVPMGYGDTAFSEIHAANTGNLPIGPDLVKGNETFASYQRLGNRDLHEPTGVGVEPIFGVMHIGPVVVGEPDQVLREITGINRSRLPFPNAPYDTEFLFGVPNPNWHIGANGPELFQVANVGPVLVTQNAQSELATLLPIAVDDDPVPSVPNIDYRDDGTLWHGRANRLFTLQALAGLTSVPAVGLFVLAMVFDVDALRVIAATILGIAVAFWFVTTLMSSRWGLQGIRAKMTRWLRL